METAPPPAQHPDLAAVLFRRTLLATAGVALIVAFGLGALTMVNVRQETRAAQELLEQAIHASRHSSVSEPGAAALQPDPAMLRGLRVQLIDAGSVSAEATGHDGEAVLQRSRPLLDRLAQQWFGVSDSFSIPLTDDADGPTLLVHGYAVGELQEQMIDMAIVLFALALAVAALGLAHGWVVRKVRDPLADMTRAADSMAEGELSRRIPEPRVAEFASLARALNHLAASLEQTRTMQRELTAELVSLRESERKALARELHDDLGQRLAVVAAETHLLRSQLKSDGVAVRSIAAGIQSLQHSVRSMLERLRQGQPMDLPDPDAAAILDDWRRREPGVTWQVDHLDDAQLDGFDAVARETLARVLQESLVNAFRHARPTQVSVRLLQHGHCAELTVRNDGVRAAADVTPATALAGYPAGTAAARHGGDGHGILGMTERAHAAGGHLRAGREETPGAWEVRLSLPKAKPSPSFGQQPLEAVRE